MFKAYASSRESPMRILLIEDDVALSDSLSQALTWHFVVDAALTGAAALEQTFVHSYDLIILDYTLPDIEAPALLEQIRTVDPDVPVLILTGYDSPREKVRMLDLGADDYVTKPYRLDELMARIRAVLRRGGAASPRSSNLVVGDLELCAAERTVRRGRTEIELRRKDFDLLEYLMRNKGRAVTRDMILDHVWDNPSAGSANLVDVHIKYLRDKVDRSFSKPLIMTVQGVGYKIDTRSAAGALVKRRKEVRANERTN